MSDFLDERAEVCDYARRMYEAGLVVGTAGNVSVRLPEDKRFAITPTSLDYETMTPEDVVVVDEERDLVLGERGPSFEADVHLAVYAARPDVHAVFHTHSIYASAYAVAGEKIPALVEEMVVYVGGEVEVAEYGRSGSDELAEAVVASLEDRAAVLLRNHGVLTAAKDLKKAYRVALLVERCAQICALARTIGKPAPLDPDVIEIEKQFYDVMKGM